MKINSSATRKLRVLQIAETYPPEYGGGAAIYIQDICRTLAARGHHVHVLCSTNIPDAQPYGICTEYDELVRVDRVNLPYFKTFDPEGWLLGLNRWRAHQRRIVALVERVLRDATPDADSVQRGADAWEVFGDAGWSGHSGRRHAA